MQRAEFTVLAHRGIDSVQHPQLWAIDVYADDIELPLHSLAAV
jgi:hypothetical protein